MTYSYYLFSIQNRVTH